MPTIAVILNSPAIVLRTIIMVVSSGTGVGVVSSAVTVAVIVVKTMNDPTICSQTVNPFCYTHVILKSTASIALERSILAYEMDEYYNATETLIGLAEALNKHMSQELSTAFAKAITSGFSLKPEAETSLTRRRQRRWGSMGAWQLHVQHEMKTGTRMRRNPESGENCILGTIGCGHNPTTSTTTTETPLTQNIDSETTNTSTTTTSTTSTSTITSTTSATSTTTSTSTSTTTTSTSASTTSTTSTTTAAISTTTEINTTTVSSSTTFTSSSIANCRISDFEGPTKRYIVFLNVSLYFNTTEPSLVDTAKIINALKQFAPSITLADRCLQKSPKESSFNEPRSKVEPPAAVTGDLSFLKNEATIDGALLSEVAKVPSPASEVPTATPAPLTTEAATPVMS